MCPVMPYTACSHLISFTCTGNSTQHSCLGEGAHRIFLRLGSMLSAPLTYRELVYDSTWNEKALKKKKKEKQIVLLTLPASLHNND